MIHRLESLKVGEEERTGYSINKPLLNLMFPSDWLIEFYSGDVISPMFPSDWLSKRASVVTSLTSTGLLYNNLYPSSSWIYNPTNLHMSNENKISLIPERARVDHTLNRSPYARAIRPMHRFSRDFSVFGNL